MVESRCRARLLLEAVQPVLVCGECGGQNLNSHSSTPVRIARPVHLPPPARAKGGDNLVRPALGARGEYAHRSRFENLPPRPTHKPACTLPLNPYPTPP